MADVGLKDSGPIVSDNRATLTETPIDGQEQRLATIRHNRKDRALQFLDAVKDRAEIEFRSFDFLGRSFSVQEIIDALSAESAELLNDITGTESASGIMSDAFKITLGGKEVVLKIPGGCGGIMDQSGSLDSAAAMFHLHPETLDRHHGSGNPYLPECHILGQVVNPNGEVEEDADTLEKGYVFVVEEYIRGVGLGSAVRDRVVTMEEATEACERVLEYFYRERADGRSDSLWDFRPNDLRIHTNENGEIIRDENGLRVTWVDGGSWMGYPNFDLDQAKNFISENVLAYKLCATE